MTRLIVCALLAVSAWSAPAGRTAVETEESYDKPGCAGCGTVTETGLFTSHYLAERLGAAELNVTRLAAGLPAGTGLDFADELTLSRALEGRRPLR